MRRLLTGLVLAVALLGGTAATVGAGQRHAAPPIGSHVVKPGETLWGIARSTYPGHDPRKAVEALSRSNHLGKRAIQPGLEIVLPRL